VFSCPKDAQKHLEKFVKVLKYTDLTDTQIIEVKKHATVGRPKKGIQPSTIGYQVVGGINHSPEKQRTLEKAKGFFILHKILRLVGYFFCFLGLHVVILNGRKRQVTNLKERHRIILYCLGPLYQKFYYSEQW
jgi:hypothetical protein